MQYLHRAHNYETQYPECDNISASAKQLLNEAADHEDDTLIKHQRNFPSAYTDVKLQWYVFAEMRCLEMEEREPPNGIV